MERRSQKRLRMNEEAAAVASGTFKEDPYQPRARPPPPNVIAEVDDDIELTNNEKVGRVLVVNQINTKKMHN